MTGTAAADRRVLELRTSIAARIRPYSLALSPEEFDRLVGQMAAIQDKYEQRELYPVRR